MAHIPRLYQPGHLAPGPVTLQGDAAKRLATVMRAAAGDPLLLFAGDGREWRAEVESVSRSGVRVRVSEVARQEAPLTVVVEAWVAVVRAARFEFALEKCTEAGADIIRPVVCEFSQRGDEPSPAKIARWQRIIVEAAEQSGRLYLPVLQAAARLPHALEAFRGAIVFGDAAAQSIATQHSLLPESGHVALAVGPEGGFSETETALLRRRGALPASFGPYILRTETAAIAGTALLRSLTA